MHLPRKQQIMPEWKKDDDSSKDRLDEIEGNQMNDRTLYLRLRVLG